ncbi:MAG: DUF2207 domain-containing protein [Methanobrevibacter sp.]|uniref:DUF2207 domain-containing protein n=1 Tax=Methanobrevibacter sp. TaxID=66852 RepID=UPI0026DF7FD3|nr:DUF2207 domain-containing protein [Methanobrevibacter sp.]MDO5848000.1 DUF2207 domain-containing protein [Methanobrevibacter sp.]
MNRKLVSIILISIFLISVLPTAFANDDDNRSYTIDLADIILNIQDNGLLKVDESYTYTFHGKYNGVYREIPLKKGQSIDNLKVSADGAYTKAEPHNEDGYYKIKVYLYSDKDLTKPIKDTSVVIHYSYDFKDVINIYNDVGEIQYKLWGDGWENGVQKLVAHINFPNDQKIEYWINPYDADAESSWSGNTLTVQSGPRHYDEYLEVRALIPLSEFKDPVYANKISQDGHDKLVKIEEDYVNGAVFKDALVSYLPLILAITLIVPVGIYLRYGREPKVIYDAPYEHEIPTDDSPIFVDAMFGKRSNVGEVSQNGIQATIMEMIGDGIIKIANKDDGNNDLKLILPENYDDLPQYKYDIIRLLLSPYARNGILDFNQMKSDLKSEYSAKAFNENLKKIRRDYANMEVRPLLRQYFDSKGSNLFKVYGIILAIVSIIVMVYAIISNPAILTLFIEGLVFLILGIFIFLLPNRYAGHWTEAGFTQYKKWEAFRKFLKDFSLIKQHPPESIAIWDKYLIYATALGDAKAVNKAMKTIKPAFENDDYYRSDVYYYSNVGGPLLFASVISTSNASANSNDNGGFGGAGGGSGGGGGGAF